MATKDTTVLDNLAKALTELRKERGKNSIREFDQLADMEVIKTQFYELNRASSIGGIPLAKIIEVSGPESSGKTTLTWQLASHLSRITGKKILFLDYEMNTDKTYLRKLNVPVENVFFGLPEDEQVSLEDGFEIAKKLLMTGAFCALIVDSVAAMVPKVELVKVEEDGLESNSMMDKAKSLARALRNYGPIFRRSGADVFFINHIIAKPAVAGGFAVMGEPEETPGGRALKFHCDIRLSLKPLGYVTKQVTSPKDPKKKIAVKIGRNIKIKFIKNRVGEPFGEAEMTLRNGKGFDIVTSTIKRGLSEGVIIKKSAGEHYLAEDPSIKAPSESKFWDLLNFNPKLVQSLIDKMEGKAVEFNVKDVDLSGATKDLTAEDLGVTIEDGAEEETDEETQTSKSDGFLAREV